MKKRILVVDDEPEVAGLLVALLTDKGGYDATAVGDATQMFQRLNDQSFDLVLLDVVLGDANGLDLAPLIKVAHPRLPVAILSALGFDEDFVKDPSQSGADAFFKKTLPPERLLAEVVHLLNRATGPAVSTR